jgi:hypothetical protein
MAGGCDAPNLVPTHFGEPEIAVGASDDIVGKAVGSRDRVFGYLAYCSDTRWSDLLREPDLR